MDTTTAPVQKLRTNRTLLKYILLSIVTLGIYSIVCFSHISEEINLVAKSDGRHTMHFCLLFFLVSWVTLGIGSLVWMNNICGRMGVNLAARNIDYKFSAGTFWGWGFFGSLILVGPFIFMYKFFKSMNLLNEDYNNRG